MPGAVECSLIRAVQDWEVRDIFYFYSTLYAMNLECGGEEKLLWIHAGDKSFSIRSLYNAMSTHSSTVFPW